MLVLDVGNIMTVGATIELALIVVRHCLQTVLLTLTFLPCGSPSLTALSLKKRLNIENQRKFNRVYEFFLAVVNLFECW